MKPAQHNAQLLAQLQGFALPIRQPATAHTFATKRMTVYQDLVFNNICDFVNRVYPIAQYLLGKAVWQHYLRAFMDKGACTSPLYIDIAMHFREYVVGNQLPGSPVWLPELLHYEWMELYVEIHDDANIALCPSWELQGDLPCFWVLGYSWPFTHWYDGMPTPSAELAPQCLVVWRNRKHVFYRLAVQPLVAMGLEHILGCPGATRQQVLDYYGQLLAQHQLPDSSDALVAELAQSLLQIHA